MLSRALRSMFAVTVLTGLALVLGCGKAAPTSGGKPGADAPAKETAKGEYNPHDVPITEAQKAELQAATAKLPDAVTKIKEFRQTIEAETKAGIPEDPYKAHQALDQVDLILQWLPNIGRDSGVPKENWEEITTTANDLRTLFEKVHQNIDDQKLPDFAAVAQEVDQKIARLEAIAQLPTAETKAG